MFKTRNGSLWINAAAIAVIVALSGCRAGGYAPPLGNGQSTAPQTQSLNPDSSPDVSVLKQLRKQVVIGSTIDPRNGAGNPYGLAVCANDRRETRQGRPSGLQLQCEVEQTRHGEIDDQFPCVPWLAQPQIHVSSDKTLVGCDALALDPGGGISATAIVSKRSPGSFTKRQAYYQHPRQAFRAAVGANLRQ